jgi:hypothetical protein
VVSAAGEVRIKLHAHGSHSSSGKPKKGHIGLD